MNIVNKKENFETSFNFTFNEQSKTITGYTGTLPPNLIIPDMINKIPVLNIGTNAFSNNELVESITIPDTVEIIFSGAFSQIKSLTQVNISDDSELQKIGSAAFKNTSITSINIPKKVTSIEAGAFTECDKLQRVDFKGDKPDIKENAFSNIGSLFSPTLGYVDNNTYNNWNGIDKIDDLLINHSIKFSFILNKLLSTLLLGLPKLLALIPYLLVYITPFIIFVFKWPVYIKVIFFGIFLTFIRIIYAKGIGLL